MSLTPMTSRFVLVLPILVAVSLGCECGDRTSKRFPRFELLDADGVARTAIDFGQVQINTRGTQGLRVHNSGAAKLTLSAATFSSPLYALATPLPVVVDPSVDLELQLTFAPTEPDQRVTATVTFASDDPDRPTAQVALAGTGVSAVAVLNPTRIDFGDVYVNETKAVTLTLTNAGSNDLVVQDARFTAGVPGSVTTDLTGLKQTLKGGAVLSATVIFAPTAQLDVGGALELVFASDLGTAQVPLKGRGVQALPRLCFKYEDSALETCTDQVTTFLSVAVGSYCDNRLFPDDGGPSACRGVDGGGTPHQRAATLWLRNEGNLPVAYSVQYDARLGTTCSDGGISTDFEFSNAPDGGAVASWTVPTVKLPANPTDPKPWEAAPIAIVYRPRSHCAVDAADQARVIWTRQLEPSSSNRAPTTLILNLTGQSQLPHGVSQDITASGTPPVETEFKGVGNVGEAPLTVSSVTLMQGQLPSDGGTVRGATPAEVCTALSTDDCAMFAFAPGANPNTLLPVTLSGTSNAGAPVTQILGRIVFGGGDAGVRPSPSHEYRVFAVIQTNDPYTPKVISTIKGVAH